MTLVRFPPPSSSTPRGSSPSATPLAARSALRRVINKLQVLVLADPKLALVLLGIIEGWLDE